MGITDLFKTKSREEAALEHLIDTQWTPSFTQLELDIRQRSVELEREGFSPEFLEGFGEFCRILRTFYDHAIYGLDMKVVLSDKEDPNKRIFDIIGYFCISNDERGVRLVPHPYFSRPSPLALFNDNVPFDERYKLLNPKYVIARAAKELIKLSPVGEAINEYRKTHPPGVEERDPYTEEIDLKRQGIVLDYMPSMFYWLQDFQPDTNKNFEERPWLNGSDAGEGDFFYATHELLGDEYSCITLCGRENLRSNFINRSNLISPGTRIPETYARKFITAKNKLEKYGAEAMGKYFKREVVMGNNGEQDGRLVLFGCNNRSGKVYYSA
ncbi:hypothetical protein HZC31_02050 [Candidatus Woesearchaeota archaeon]|nr:hypothetical protein [Candidatus Woesearchaeota archaeon]